MLNTTAEFAAARRPRKLPSQPESRRTSLQHAGMFFKNFTRHPHLVGSAIPSSRYLVNRVLHRVNWQRTHTVVEYGPGVGTFTRHILARMAPDARLLAIELNDDFCRVLAREIQDPRFQLVQGSAREVSRWMATNSLPCADFIMSGLPYTLFSHELRQSILNASHDALSAQGVFVSFQYTRAVVPDLRAVFPRIREDFELINILPAWVFYCRA